MKWKRTIGWTLAVLVVLIGIGVIGDIHLKSSGFR